MHFRTQLPRVWFPAFMIIYYLIVDVAEVYWWPCCLEQWSAEAKQCRSNPSSTGQWQASTTKKHSSLYQDSHECVREKLERLSTISKIIRGLWKREPKKIRPLSRRAKKMEWRKSDETFFFRRRFDQVWGKWWWSDKSVSSARRGRDIIGRKDSSSNEKL